MIDDQNLNQHRGGADDLNISGGQKCNRIEFADGNQRPVIADTAIFTVGKKAQRPKIGHSHNCQHDAEDESDDHREQSQHHRDYKTLFK